jgi:hypothetical protein
MRICPESTSNPRRQSNRTWPSTPSLRSPGFEDDDEYEDEAPGDREITNHLSPSMPVQNLQNSVIGKALGLNWYV